MDHISQLKKIRAEAIARLRNSDDFKLAGKLGSLIVELGDTVEDVVDYAPKEDTVAATSSIFSHLKKPEVEPLETVSSFERPDASPFKDLTNEEVIEELVAEIEGDSVFEAVTEDESDDDGKDAAEDKIGPFLKPSVVNPSYANGSAH